MVQKVFIETNKKKIDVRQFGIPQNVALVVPAKVRNTNS